VILTKYAYDKFILLGSKSTYKMLHLNPPLVVSDNVTLSGGPSCKWYINLEVPEAKALAAR